MENFVGVDIQSATFNFDSHFSGVFFVLVNSLTYGIFYMQHIRTQPFCQKNNEPNIKDIFLLLFEHKYGSFDCPIRSEN